MILRSSLPRVQPSMFSPQLIALIALAYVGFLFGLAWFGDRIPARRLGRRTRAVIYSLSLAVYCTSWTFFGAVGSAASDGWLFATIYIGPILVLVLGHDLMHRILKLSREQRLTSIADFIAHRFGKSRPLAVLVTHWLRCWVPFRTLRCSSRLSPTVLS